MDYTGAFTAIITPFSSNNDLDEEGLRKNIKSQIKGGIDGIVPMGTTGECATVSHEEHERVIEISVDTTGGKIPVIAGTGSNSTREALRLTTHAAEAGVDAVLLICPYYNKPTQRGIYEHYKKLAKKIEIPQIIYNIPSRTGRNIEPETIIRLSKLENIVGVKEASGSLKQIMKIIKNTDNDFYVLSGDDSLTLPALSLGATGVVSVASNLIPGKISEMINLYLDGKTEASKEIHYELTPLFESLFIETNPAPVKAAMDLLGKPAGGLRLPLVEVRDETRKHLKKVLSDIKLL